MLQSATKYRGQRLDIQGLRMLAVASVVVNHLIGWPAGGFVGVDVFFVISGFLITGLLLREYDRNGRISMVGFYRRRIKRLMPAALTVLAATLVVGAFVLPRPRATDLAWEALFSTVFLANWRFASTGTDYFAAGQAPSALQHYWSLSVEEQFYVVWPLLIIAMLCVIARLRGTTSTRRWSLLAAILLVTTASMIWAAIETDANQTVAYFSTLSRGWELGTGAALAIGLQMTKKRLPRWLAVVIAYVGFAGIMVSWLVVDQNAGFPWPAAMLPVMSTALVLFAGADQETGYSSTIAPLTNRVATYIGDISYSLYLWHFPVIILGTAFLQQGSAAHLIVSLILMTALSVGSYHLIENPARKAEWFARPWLWRSKRFGVVAGVLVFALVLTPVTWVQVVDRQGNVPHEQVATADCQGAAAMVNNCDDESLTGATTPSIDNLSDDTGVAYDCWRYEGTEFGDCATALPRTGGFKVAVIGDSHAAMYLTSFESIAEERGWELDRYVGYSCQWVDGMEQRDCASSLDGLRSTLLNKDDPYDLVITAAARWAFEEQEDSAHLYAKTWSEVAAIGTKVVVIESVPTVTDDAYACVQRFQHNAFSGCGMTAEDAGMPHDPFPEAAEEAGVSMLKTNDLFCKQGECPMQIGGFIVYRDTLGHLTDSYLQTMTPYLAERLDALLE